MRRLLLIVLSCLALSFVHIGGASALGANPVFGTAKVVPLSKEATKGVTAKTGSQTALYLYYGLYYTSYALQNASIGQYYNYTHSSSASSYLYNAYYYSYYATQYFYYAYYYFSTTP